MKRILTLFAVVCLILPAMVGCVNKGVETGNPKPPIVEASYLLSTSDGEKLYSIEIDPSGTASISLLDSDGETVVEEVTGEVVIDEDTNTFSVDVVFSDGTSVTAAGGINEEGEVTEIGISVDGALLDTDVCLSSSGGTSGGPIERCDFETQPGLDEGNDETPLDSDKREAPDVAYDSLGALWVSAQEGSDENAGTIDRPMGSIGEAIRRTESLHRQDGIYKAIYVVRGTYDEEITLAGGFAIFGGYGLLGADSKRYRDIEENETVINLSRSCGVLINDETPDGEDAVVEGFIIRGVGVAICINDASPTVRYNEIEVLGGRGDYLCGIEFRTVSEEKISSPRIEENRISVGDTLVLDGRAKGISYITGPFSESSVALIDNEISVGDGRRSSMGVSIFHNVSSKLNLTAVGNTVSTGRAGIVSSAIDITPWGEGRTVKNWAMSRIDRNLLIVGAIDPSLTPGGPLEPAAILRTHGLSSDDSGTPLLITNNIIIGGREGAESSGISIKDVWYTKIYNNTIFAGSAKTRLGGIFVSGRALAEVINNILCADEGVGIYKSDDRPLMAVGHNLFCDGVVQLVRYSSSSYDDLPSLNELAYAEGNIMGDPLFLNEEDYHIDPESPAVGGGVDIEDVPTDIDGEFRSPGSFDIGADQT